MSENKDKAKGLTFSRVIVVLVVLAFLAAIIVPVVLVNMDKATEKQYMVHAKSAYTAAQSIAAEMASRGENPAAITEDKYINEITKKAELNLIDCTGFKIGFKSTDFDDGKSGQEQHDCYLIQYAEYTENGITYSYNGSVWEPFSSPEQNLLVIK